jgi:CRISPR/Cas system-associated exonuclease Cas4 (RecB family)
MELTMSLLDMEIPDPRRLDIPGARIIHAVNHPLIARIQVLPEPVPGEKRPKIRGEYVSASQISKYSRCQAQYLFHYYHGVREPVDSGLIFGSALHRGAEVYLAAKRHAARKDTAFDHEAARTAAIDAAALYVRAEVRTDMKWKTQWQNGPTDTFETLLESVKVATEKMADATWQNMSPQAVEHGYVIEWHDPNVLPILGYTDVIDRIITTRDDGTVIEEDMVVDLKSGKEKKQGDANVDVALSFYAQAREIETGRPVRKVGYKSYVRNKEPKIVEVQVERDENTLARSFVRARALTNLRRLMFDDPKQYVMPADDSSKCTSCFYKANGMCDREFGTAAAYGPQLRLVPSTQASKDATTSSTSTDKPVDNVVSLLDFAID